MVEQGKPRLRGSDGRFRGRRCNLETVPRLSAATVRWVVDDIRQIPYLFAWWKEGVELHELVRVAALPGGPAPARDGEEWVSIGRPFQQVGLRALRLLRRPLPRHGGTDLLLGCPICGSPRRHLYGYGDFRCRRCADLRYGSEGTYVRKRLRGIGGYPRADVWDPYCIATPADVRAFLATLGLNCTMVNG